MKKKLRDKWMSSFPGGGPIELPADSGVALGYDNVAFPFLQFVLGVVGAVAVIAAEAVARKFAGYLKIIHWVY